MENRKSILKTHYALKAGKPVDMEDVVAYNRVRGEMIEIIREKRRKEAAQANRANAWLQDEEKEDASPPTEHDLNTLEERARQDLKSYNKLLAELAKGTPRRTIPQTLNMTGTTYNNGQSAIGYAGEVFTRRKGRPENYVYPLVAISTAIREGIIPPLEAIPPTPEAYDGFISYKAQGLKDRIIKDRLALSSIEYAKVTKTVEQILAVRTPEHYTALCASIVKKKPLPYN